MHIKAVIITTRCDKAILFAAFKPYHDFFTIKVNRLPIGIYTKYIIYRNSFRSSSIYPYSTIISEINFYITIIIIYIDFLFMIKCPSTVIFTNSKNIRTIRRRKLNRLFLIRIETEIEQIHSIFTFYFIREIFRFNRFRHIFYTKKDRFAYTFGTIYCYSLFLISFRNDKRPL